MIDDDDDGDDDIVLGGVVRPRREAAASARRAWASDLASGSGENSEDEGAQEDQEQEQREEEEQVEDLQSTATEEGYLRGSIVRVKLHNFVTYDDVEFYPGPHLNVIMGPNGTGKSSVACAIALCCCAKASVMGRSNNPRDFVKQGRDVAVVELEFSGGRGRRNVVVSRTIPVDARAHAVSHIDGRAATVEAVQRLCAALRVQPDNLCQFLPQDRVADFSRMGPQELLRATERAAGPAGMLETHRRLGALQRQLTSDEQQAVLLEGAIQQLQERLARQRDEIARYEEVQRMLRELDALKKECAWMRVKEQCRRVAALRDARAAAEAAHARAERDAAAAASEHAAQRKQLDRLVRDRDRIQQQQQGGSGSGSSGSSGTSGSSNSNSSLEEQRQLEQRMGELDDEERGVVRMLAAARTEAAQAAERVSELRGKLDAARRELGARGRAADVEARVRALEEEQVPYNAQLLDLEAKNAEGRRQAAVLRARLGECERRLRALQDERARDVRRLQEWSPDVHAALVWVQQQQQRGGVFRGHVLGPVCVECRGRDARYAAYLEAAAGRFLTAFVTDDAADKAVLEREFAQRGRGRITVLCVDAGHAPPQRAPLADTLRDRGIVGCVLDGVRGPDLVLEALCDMCSLGSLLVADTDELRDPLTLPPCTVYTPGSVLSVTQSRYGARDKSVLQRPLAPARFVGGGGPNGKGDDSDSGDAATRALQAERAQLVAELERVQGDFARADADCAGVRRDLAALQERLRAARGERQALEAAARRVQELHDLLRVTLAHAAPGDQEQRLRDRAAAVVVRRARCAAQLAACTAARARTALRGAGSVLAEAVLERRVAAARERAQQAAAAEAAARTAVREAAAQLEPAEREARELKRRAQDAAPYTDELRAKVRAGTRSVRDYEREIERLSARAEMNMYTSPRVVSEYEAQQRECAAKTGDLQRLQQRTADTRATIARLRAAWLPPLRTMVARIHGAFARAMRAMRCDGEVVLGDTAQAYDDYSLEIRVAFRAGQGLQLLSQSVQSGGEKSVSTMLFLIALQDLTESPFRLVDEINQGMDADNERMVFSQVARSCAAPGKPQCFLITPKLLANLDYTTAMDIHCIFNGPYNVPTATPAARRASLTALAPGSLASKRRRSVVGTPHRTSTNGDGDGDDDDEC